MPVGKQRGPRGAVAAFVDECLAGGGFAPHHQPAAYPRVRDGMPGARWSAAEVLAHLARSPEFNAAIVGAGAISPIVALVRDGVPDARWSAANMLA